MPATNKYIIIDGEEYRVPIASPMDRSADILDLTAHRTEDGVLHREVIGTYYNYTLNFLSSCPRAEYERLWWKISEPVASHLVRLPYQEEASEMYFSSVKDNVVIIDANGKKCKGLSCKLTMTRPSRVAGE